MNLDLSDSAHEGNLNKKKYVEIFQQSEVSETYIGPYPTGNYMFKVNKV